MLMYIKRRFTSKKVQQQYRQTNVLRLLRVAVEKTRVNDSIIYITNHK